NPPAAGRSRPRPLAADNPGAPQATRDPHDPRRAGRSGSAGTRAEGRGRHGRSGRLRGGAVLRAAVAAGARSPEEDRAVSPPQVDVDFSDPGLIADPFSVYEEIRAAGHVVWNGAANVWMVPGFDDCAQILTDTKGVRYGVIGARYPELTFWFDAPNMIIADPPDHRRLRHGLAKYFTP